MRLSINIGNMVTKKVMNMCKAIEDMVDEGKIIGAIAMCKDFGVTFEETISKIIDKFKVSTKEAEDIVKKNW